MKQFNGFNAAHNVTPNEGQERLPVGSYVCKILSACCETMTNGNECLIISFDVAEGEHAGYYTKKYEAAKDAYPDAKYKGTYRIFAPSGDGSEKDGWTLNRFNKDIGAIEDSNNGFKWAWNEAALKGKTVGVVMRDREWEYNGNFGTMTEPAFLCSAESARAGLRKAKPKLLKKSASPASSATAGFYETTSEELPF